MPGRGNRAGHGCSSSVRAKSQPSSLSGSRRAKSSPGARSRCVIRVCRMSFKPSSAGLTLCVTEPHGPRTSATGPNEAVVFHDFGQVKLSSMRSSNAPVKRALLNRRANSKSCLRAAYGTWPAHDKNTLRTPTARAQGNAETSVCPLWNSHGPPMLPMTYTTFHPRAAVRVDTDRPCRAECVHGPVSAPADEEVAGKDAAAFISSRGSTPCC